MEQEPRPRPVFSQAKPRIDELLEEWGKRTTAKQRITGSRLHRQLREEGLQVGITVVRDYLRQLRVQRAEVFVPLVHHPGAEAQVDFFEVTVDVADRRPKAWPFVMRLMYSKRDFACIYDQCDQIAFLDGHVRAFEQYDLADPKNRLVVDTLEQRLNARLKELRLARQDLEDARKTLAPLTPTQKEEVAALSRDLPRLWEHPEIAPSLRKQLLRIAIREVVVTHNQQRHRLEFKLHWEGDVCTDLSVKKRKTPVGSKASTSLIETVRELSQTLDDAQIARILNMKRIQTPRQLRWTKDRVLGFRRQHRIRQCRPKPDDENRFLTCQQAREYLGVGYNGLLGLIRLGVIHTNQVTDFAPWRIPREELDSEVVQDLVATLKATGRLPKGGCPQTQTCIFRGKSTE